MKKSFLILLKIIFIHSCTASNPSLDIHQLTNFQDQKKIIWNDAERSDIKTLEVITYVEEAYSWRNRAIANFRRIEDYRKKHHGKISSKDLLDMHQAAIVYVGRIRRRLLEILESEYSFIRTRNEIKLQTESKTYIEWEVPRYEDIWGNIINNKETLKEKGSYREVKVNVFHVNPSDSKGQLVLRDFKVSLLASLVLLDNYVLGLKPYLNNKTLRRSLFYDIPDPHQDTRKAIKNIWKDRNKHQISSNLIRAVHLYNQAQLISEKLRAEPTNPYLEELKFFIQESLAYKELMENPKEEGLVKRLSKRVKQFFRKRRDEIFLVRRGTTHILSKVFGTGAGAFQLRDGKLRNMPEKELEDLLSKLRPLDILIEKTPFRLTDKFIPGHFGHIGIWAGTEKELRELGVWEMLPQIYQISKKHYSYDGPSFQDSIRSGRQIIEALRPGVEINSLRHFLNIDDLAIIRPKFCLSPVAFSKPCLPLKDQRRYLLAAFKQIGKDYDFNFDVNTREKIVCSEIAYRTFVGIDFETTKALGKHSISPDQVAFKANEVKDPFYPILLYFRGKRVSGGIEYLREVFNFLLQKDYKAVEKLIESTQK